MTVLTSAFTKRSSEKYLEEWGEMALTWAVSNPARL